MFSRKELEQRDKVAQTFPHLLAFDGYHIVVHPVVNHRLPLRSYSLRYLALVVGEHEVHSSSMYVELCAEVFSAHRRAFTVPTRKTIAPRAGPAHNVLGLGFLPKGEVHLIMLFFSASQIATVVNDVVEITSRQHTVVILLVVLFYIEIDRAISLVGETIAHNLLYKFFLLDDVARGVRLNTGRQHVEYIHCSMVAVCIELRYFHRFELFELCFLSYFVVAVICIVFEMAYVCNVAHIAHFVAQVLEIAEQNIEGDGWTRMSQMGIAVNGGTAYIHTDTPFMDRFE